MGQEDFTFVASTTDIPHSMGTHQRAGTAGSLPFGNPYAATAGNQGGFPFVANQATGTAGSTPSSTSGGGTHSMGQEGFSVGGQMDGTAGSAQAVNFGGSTPSMGQGGSSFGVGGQATDTAWSAPAATSDGGTPSEGQGGLSVGGQIDGTAGSAQAVTLGGLLGAPRRTQAVSSFEEETKEDFGVTAGSARAGSGNMSSQVDTMSRNTHFGIPASNEVPLFSSRSQLGNVLDLDEETAATAQFVDLDNFDNYGMGLGVARANQEQGIDDREQPVTHSDRIVVEHLQNNEAFHAEEPGAFEDSEKDSKPPATPGSFIPYAATTGMRCRRCRWDENGFFYHSCGPDHDRQFVTHLKENGLTEEQAKARKAAKAKKSKKNQKK